jgi:sulfur-oxidizing protein SoxA
MFEMGKQMFAYRAGPYDFGCSTCHRQTGKRIRLQALPDLTTAEGAKFTYSSWPGYRISEGTVRTMDWRMADCARQQRLPELILGSDISVALISYMAVMANGAELNVPGLKR